MLPYQPVILVALVAVIGVVAGSIFTMGWQRIGPESAVAGVSPNRVSSGLSCC